jgi:vacuolar-type H+-ATPase subunit C/Vma6
MKNQTEIERLEELILNGGNVSPAELADAMRNSDAEKRIAQLTAERTVRNAQSDLEQLATLNRRVASDNLTPQQRTVAALEILDLEQKNTGEK